MTSNDQLFRSWSQLDMASVLSGWYGYNIHHNIFNVANFIEYEPYPKRRKLDKSNSYRTTEQAYEQEYELVHRDSASRVKKHNVAYRPYSDLQHNVKQKPSKKSYSKSDSQIKTRVKNEEEPQDGTTIDNIFPEILCLIFETLDLQSKGRAAQV